MTASSIFAELSSRRIAKLISGATKRVIYAAPGIQPEPANALLELHSQLIRPELTIAIDFNEQTLRMGFGDLEAAKMLRDAGVRIKHSPGFRCGILIVDDRGWTFSPVAHYLEAEPQSDETPNAVVLSPEQVRELAVRLSDTARREAVEQAATPEMAAEIEQLPLELGEIPISNEHFTKVSEAIKAAPPVKFDVVRQVRVFEPYLQYVEMHLTGAAIQKHKVQIPPAIHNLGKAKDLEGRLRTTFALIEKSSSLSSKDLEEELNAIRKNFTRTLGKEHGRVVLKSAKPTLEIRVKEFRNKLDKHRKAVGEKLTKQLAASRKQVVDYYLPLVKAKPPDAIIGQTLAGKPTKEDCRRWIEQILEGVFPSTDKLIQGMTLEVTYKEATFETLNRPDFLDSVKAAYPNVDWDKAYKEFKAAGEKKDGQTK